MCVCLIFRAEVTFVVVVVMSALGAKLEMNDPSGVLCVTANTHTHTPPSQQRSGEEERERERQRMMSAKKRDGEVKREKENNVGHKLDFHQPIYLFFLSSFRSVALRKG